MCEGRDPLTPCRGPFDPDRLIPFDELLDIDPAEEFGKYEEEKAFWADTPGDLTCPDSWGPLGTWPFMNPPLFEGILMFWVGICWVGNPPKFWIPRPDDWLPKPCRLNCCCSDPGLA